MQIKYTTQRHQTKAIESIVELFRGQSRQVCEYDIFDGEAVCGNRYILDDMAILDNLHSIQKRNGIEVSSVLETGTGKTY